MRARGKPKDIQPITLREGGPYYIRVRVSPERLRKLLKTHHLQESLRTKSLTEAHRLKHAVIARLKDELEERQRLLAVGDEAAASAKPLGGRKLPTPNRDGIPDPDEFRALRREYEAAGDARGLESLDAAMSHVVDRILHAEQRRRARAGLPPYVDVDEDGREFEPGTDAAMAWQRKAADTTETIRELAVRWCADSAVKASTQAGRMRAVRGLLEHLNDPDARPSAVTRPTAARYIDALKASGRAAKTIQDTAADLGVLWHWMGTRGNVPENVNPWRNHHIDRNAHPGSRPPRRAFTDAELVRLLKGNETVRTWSRFYTLAELLVLGMFTGARIEELCARVFGDVEEFDGGVLIRIRDAKTKAGVRSIPIVHAAPVSVVRRRLALPRSADDQGQLFPELYPGGLDMKFSKVMVSTFTRYRRACGIADGPDFHSLRRNAITVMEEAMVGLVELARFVGHEVGTLAHDRYSTGATVARMIEVAAKVRFPVEVEAAAMALVAEAAALAPHAKSHARRRQRTAPKTADEMLDAPIRRRRGVAAGSE